MLFTTCKLCSSAAVNIEKSISGSLLRIKQFCRSCKRTWCWDSQHFIGSIPAGNILMSAAILYSGSLPTHYQLIQIMWMNLSKKPSHTVKLAQVKKALMMSQNLFVASSNDQTRCSQYSSIAAVSIFSITSQFSQSFMIIHTYLATIIILSLINWWIFESSILL